MNADDRWLEELLLAAGRGAAPPPQPTADLAKRVRALHRRRRRVRRAAASAALGLLLLGGVIWAPLPLPPIPPGHVAPAPSPRPHGQTPRMAAEEIDRLRQQIARLDAEARQRRERLQCLVRLRRAGIEAVSGQDDVGPAIPADSARIEIEKTAFLLTEFAGECLADDDGRSAARHYRRVLELFPRTKAAETARKRLNQIQTHQGDL